MTLGPTDPDYIITTQPKYGEVIGVVRPGSAQVVFTDDFNKFIDELLRIVKSNYVVIAQLLDALGYDGSDISDILDNGLDPLIFANLTALISESAANRAALSALERRVAALENVPTIIRSFDDRINSLEVAVTTR